MARPRRVLAPKNKLLAKWLERWQKVVQTTSQEDLATLAVFALSEHARVLSKQPQLESSGSSYDYAALSPTETADFHSDMLVYQEALPDHHSMPAIFFLSALYEALRFGSERKTTKRQADSYFTPAYWALNFVNQLKKEELLTGPPEQTFTVLEPCAGSGNLLFAFLGWVAENVPELWERLEFHAYEKDQCHFQALKILWPLALESLRPRLPAPQAKELGSFFQADFLEESQNKATLAADLILLNPPWSSSRPNIRRSARETDLAATTGKKKLSAANPRESTPSYREFLEAALASLKPGGLLSAIVPGGFLSDKGTSSLRRRLFDQGTWLRTCVFSNKQAHFPVHPDYEFLFLYFQAQGKTSAMSLLNEDNPQATLLQRSFLEKLSSRYLLIPSFLEAKSLIILEKMLETQARLFTLETRGGGPFNYRREFDLSQLDRQTSKSLNHHLGLKENLLPVIEGRMLQAYACADRELMQDNTRGKSEATAYRASHLIPESLYRKRVPDAGAKVAYVAVSGRRNRRMLKAALTPDLPHGSSVPVFSLPREKEEEEEAARKKALPLVALLNSSCFDFFLRATLAGNNLNYYWLSQVPIPLAFGEQHLDANSNTNAQAALLLQSLANLAAKISFDEKQVQLIMDGQRVILPSANKIAEEDAQTVTALSKQECVFLADIIIAKLYKLSLEEYELLFGTSFNRGFFHSYSWQEEGREHSSQAWPQLVCKLYNRPFTIACL